MCTILLQSETLPAEKRSSEDSQAEVDKLMEYDRKLSEPFTREELQKIFGGERLGNTSISKYCDTSAIERYIDYTLLTDAEKEIGDHLNQLVRQSVEDTINSLLDAEADAICCGSPRKLDNLTRCKTVRN